MEKKGWLGRLASDLASRSLSSPGDVCRQHTDHYTVELLAAVMVNINFVASNKVEQNELGSVCVCVCVCACMHVCVCVGGFVFVCVPDETLITALTYWSEHLSAIYNNQYS